MSIFLFVFILGILLVQFFYLCRFKKQEKELLNILRNIRSGDEEKLFSKGKGYMSTFSFEFNEIMTDKQNKITELKKENEANKQILTSLSHDIRTPLASLLGYLEALENQQLDEKEKQEYISVAFRKANDLKTYVDVLFEWFKLTGGEYQLYIKEIDIIEKTREIIIEWLPILEQSKISLVFDTKEEELIIPIDSLAYSRILNNLIKNAIQHGKCQQITISITHNDNKLFISVGNNGSIISKEHLPFIFERLYKVDKARTEKGSGLGLAITKELVTALNGEISVSSTQDEGTTFQITLSMKPLL